MIVVERSSIVTTTPAMTLDFLRDYANLGHWHPATRRIVRAGTGPLLPGASWRHTMAIGGVVTDLTCTLLADEGWRLIFAGRSDGATSTEIVQVHPHLTGAHVGYRVELELHGLAKLATPLLKTKFEKLCTQGAARLTAVLTPDRPSLSPS
jgi:hypothetical protein